MTLSVSPALTTPVKDLAKRFFTANLTMKDRANLFAASGVMENGFPLVTEGVGGALGHAFGSLDGLVGLASLALFFFPVSHPIVAGIFAAAVLFSAFKAGKYALSALGSLVSFDIMGFLTNGLAAAMYAITALPVGRLFREGLTPTINAIQGIARGSQRGGQLLLPGFEATGRETVGNYIFATARHLYDEPGKQVLEKGLRQLPGYLRNIGQGISSKAKRFADRVNTVA